MRRSSGPRDAAPGPRDAAPEGAAASSPHVCARSALADAPALVGGPDVLPAPLPSGAAGHRRRLAALMATGLVVGAVALALAGAQAILA